MGFFTRRRDKKLSPNNAQAAPEPPTQNRVSEPHLTARGNYRWIDFDEQIALKFWMPDSLQQLLDGLASVQNESASSLVRRTLFMYLYGRYDYFAIKQARASRFDPLEQDVLYQPNIPRGPVKARGPRGGRMPEMGKNYLSLKVWLPKRMRDDLQQLADASNITLSHHIREVMATDLIGRVFLPDRDLAMQEPEDYQSVVGQFEKDMEAWEQAQADESQGSDFSQK